MSEEQKNNVPLIGEIFVEGEAPPQYYQAFLDAQAAAEDAADRAERAAEHAMKNIGLTVFGVPYSSAVQVIDVSAAGDESVKLHLFLTANGYDAVVTYTGVTGNGTIKDFAAPKVETYNGGLIDVAITENRPYAEQVQKINRLHIGKGITGIGDHFMHEAYNLKHLSFEDSKSITRLGAYAFAKTQISGVYDFSGLGNTVLDCPFESCPKLEGLTFNENVESITARSFQFCLALRNVAGITGVTQIGDAAFQYCVSLDSLDVDPGNITLGSWTFILTPNEAKVEATETCLFKAEWADPGYLCFTQNEWTEEQREAIQEVTAGSVALPIPESDQQYKVAYHQWGVFPLIYQGAWYAEGQRASGCCGIFCLYHIYNIRHPNAQYDTFYDFIRNEIAPKKILVTQELRTALEATENGRILLNTRQGIYEVGKEITALDLPMALDDATETWGEIGTTHWGICEVLGWDATEQLFEDYSGADMKQLILDELHAGRPVQMEIVGADTAGHGMHAVTAIGYDSETDKLKLIDSTGWFPKDIVPLVYELPFEALITPDAASCIWTFDFGEEITMTDIDGKLGSVAESNDRIEGMLKAINSGFRKVTGSFTLDNTINPGENLVIEGLPSNAYIVEVRAEQEVPIETLAYDEISTYTFISYAEYMSFDLAPRILSGRTDEYIDALCCSYVQYTRYSGNPGCFGFFGEDTTFAVGEDGTGTLTHTLRATKTSEVEGVIYVENTHIKSHTAAGEQITYNWTAYCWDE